MVGVMSVTIPGGGIMPTAHVRVEEFQEVGNSRWVPPVPLKVSSDGELGQDYDTGFSHPSIREVSRAGIKRAGSVGVGEDGIPGLEERQGSKHRADLW